MQRAQGVFHLRVHRVLAPALGVEAFTVVAHRLFHPRRFNEQRREGGAQRRTDPAQQCLLRRYRMVHLLQRIGDARGNADLRIDQRTVEVEEQDITATIGAHAPRASRAATAGSVLPSRNSRNAPPPVEM
ncbi:hypothetical protein G6F58_013061 [Rhizopus delemar]|nr:hypothetical protein G6F58_013061 [Rhizopus delemar]